jgi:hypothetical protein
MNLTHLSANDESGVVVKVHKQLGDAVSEGELVLEIETTKAILEVVSTLTGTISFIAPAASRVRVGDCLLEVGGKGAVAGTDAAGGPQRAIGESLRKRMSDEAFALIQASGGDVLAALPATGLITAKLVKSILAGRPEAAPRPMDLETFLAARSNEKYCAYVVSHAFEYRPDISEDLLVHRMASRSAEFLGLLARAPAAAGFSVSVVVDLKGFPVLVEIDREVLGSLGAIAETKLERVLQLRRRGAAESFATRSIFAVSTLNARHVSHHFPIVPENHAAVFGLLISPHGCSITLGYDHRRLSGFNAARMVDAAVSLLTDPA